MASRFPERPAVKTRDAILTYGELNRAANRTARQIVARGLDRRVPIPVVAKRVATTLVALLATQKAGWISTCLNPSWPSAQLVSVLARLEAELVITDSNGLQQAEKLATDTLECNVSEGVTGSWEDGNLRVEIPPDSPASIIFTSGSTGIPNGVIQSHRNLVHYVAEQTRELQLTADDRMPLLFPLSGMAGLMASLRALLSGATLVAFDLGGEGAERLPVWIEDERITVLHALPSVFRQLEAAAQGRSQFATIRRVYLSGEAVMARDTELFKLLFPNDCLLYNTLGATEVSSFRRLCVAQGTDVPPGRLAAGFAVAGKEVRLLDATGEEVGAGRVGEICVRGPYLSPGYWRNEELTRKRFPRDTLGNDGSRCYLTGDLGRLGTDGCLEYLGRKDHQVKVRGYRVEMGDVEVALLSLPDIEDAVVVSRRRSDAETSMVAYVVAAAATNPTLSQVRRDLASLLPGYMVPARLVMLESLPRLAGGKVDRVALPLPGATRPDLETPLVMPYTPIERQLAAVWADVLGIDPVGLNDHFLELGGDSLMAVGLVSQVELVTGRRVPIERLGSITSIQAMADAMLGEAGVSCGVDLAGKEESWDECRRRMVAVAAGSRVSLLRKGSTIARMNPGGTRTPLFWCFNRYDVEMPLFGEALGSDQPVYGLFSGSGVAAATDEFVHTLADHYADEVMSLQVSGPLLLGGNCRGARVALEVASRLRARGRVVGRLCFLEFFDQRLFVEMRPTMLLYGRDSHLKAYEPFRWGENRWEAAFRRPPQVDWVPGGHGEFFSRLNIESLVGRVRGFLGGDELG